jgi:hypothetical protein
MEIQCVVYIYCNLLTWLPSKSLTEAVNIHNKQSERSIFREWFTRRRETAEKLWWNVGQMTG